MSKLFLVVALAAGLALVADAASAQIITETTVSGDGPATSLIHPVATASGGAAISQFFFPAGTGLILIAAAFS